ncbi:MAG: glycosyltransferase family 39 protein [Chloroflexi bacterium]|nr:glycosyltransferase family 39 protein [Chloroflexota bacterium]
MLFTNQVKKIKNISLSNETKWLWLALILASSLKVILLILDIVPFNSDESIVALMARHILQGERPLFFYGQAYMGSLDAWLVAFGFLVFGQHVWVLRFVQGILFLGVLVSTVKLAEIALDSRRTGILASLLLALPAVNMTLYTTVTLGGYNEALLLGNIILILGLLIVREIKQKKRVVIKLWLALGFFVGIGFWTFGLTLVYSIPVGIYLFWVLWQNKTYVRRQALRGAGSTLVGIVAGSWPWWLFAAQGGIQQLLGELTGSAIADIHTVSPWVQPFQRFMSLVLFGGTAIFGMRPPWAVRWLGLPLLPFVLAFWLGVIYLLPRNIRENRPAGKVVLLGVMLTLIIGFLFTPFGDDPSGRYFVPLLIPLTLFASDLILKLGKRDPRWVYGLTFLLISFHLMGTFQSALRYPPGITTQFDAVTQIDHRYDEELIAFLLEHGEMYGYTNYWVAYPLAFKSEEKLIFTPRLPYHLDFRYTIRDDRYAPYDTMVAEAARAAYITTHHDPLNAYLREKFSAMNITWEETKIGDFVVFYELSNKIIPEQLDLGSTTDAWNDLREN